MMHPSSDDWEHIEHIFSLLQDSPSSGERVRAETEVAEVVEVLTQIKQAATPDEATQMRVWEQIVTRNSASMNGNVAARDRQFARSLVADNRLPRRWYVRVLRPMHRWVPLLSVGAVMILILAVALAVHIEIGHAQPVSASEILQKAVAATRNPAGIKNFHLRRQYAGWLTTSGGGPDTITTVEQWGSAPDHWRTDTVYQFCPQCREVVGEGSDGMTRWSYQSSEQVNGQSKLEVRLGAAPSADTSRFLRSVRIGVPVNLGAAETDIPTESSNSQCYSQAKFDGEAIVAGRTAYVIDLGPNSCPEAASIDRNGTVTFASPTPPAQQGRNILWVDKQTFFFLKQERYKTDGTLKFRNEIVQIQYNGSIPDSTFSYIPPADAIVIDRRPAPYVPPPLSNPPNSRFPSRTPTPQASGP